uniref:hypothetical protein n=1 Tax=Bradyrhizobium sp. SZCCHNR3111 TaxID=3057463 RepID=UPI00291601FF
MTRTLVATVEKLPDGNGLVFPWVVKCDGDMLRNSDGVARRFMTERAAQAAAKRAGFKLKTEQG